MTWVIVIAIFVVVSLAMFVVVWAAVAAGARADAVQWTVDDLRLLEEARAPRPAETHPAVAVVADIAELTKRLDAAAVLLRARRVAVIVSRATGEHTVASGGEGEIGPHARRATAPIGEHTVLVASRARPEPFGPADLRLLGAVADTVADVLGVGGPTPSRRGRFDRVLSDAAKPPRAT